MYFLIYKITNLINNKIYIGKHITNNKNDDYMGSGVLINKAYKKYGINNFKKEILFECKSEEELNQKEAELVNEEFISNENTYNIAIGGKGNWKHAMLKHKSLLKDKDYYVKYCNKLKAIYQDQKIRNKISIKLKLAHIKRPFNFIGKKLSIKSINQMKRTFVKIHHQQGENNSQFGKVWIYNLDLKISKSIKKEELDLYLNQGWLKGRKLKF